MGMRSKYSVFSSFAAVHLKMISILKQMGNGQSQIHPTYLGIYTKLIQIQSVHKRAETIQTLLSAPEYVNAAKQLGVYSSLLQYVANVQNGRQPGLLPGEQQRTSMPQFQAPQIQQRTTLVNYQAPPSDPYEQLAQSANNDRALNYFQTCLQVLELEEEVALTEEALKVAYKKAALKSHPDKKGGSEKAFELVTRSYAYLTEILRRVRGGRDQLRKVEAPTSLKDTRFKESDEFQHVKPIRINPDKMDMNAFNQMFEKTRMPDPDDEGYGDWLRTEDSSGAAATFSGKFNRDVFHKMFEDETAKNARSQKSTTLTIAAPQSLMLAPSMGVELGRDRPETYTAAANASLKYTDLKAAYTTESTFSGQVSDVRVDPRDYETYANTRKRAPDPLKDDEREAIAYAEKAMEEREKQRAYRAANEGIAANDYFERMKQLVITDGVPIGKTKRK